MVKKNTREREFKRIRHYSVTLRHLIADVFALLLTYYIFGLKYDLPYHQIFSSIIPSPIKPYSIEIVLITITSIWLFSFYLSGHYTNTARKSGLQILGPTLITCFVLSVLSFFILTLYTETQTHAQSLPLSIRYFSLSFSFVFLFRMILIIRHQYLIQKGKIVYYVLLVGSNNKAKEIIENHIDSKNRIGYIRHYHFIGYIDAAPNENNDLSSYIPHLGNISDIDNIIKNHSFDEAFVSLQGLNHREINYVINTLRQKNILIKLSVDINDMLDGTVKTHNLEFSPFITITNCSMPTWQNTFKSVLDYTLAWIGLIISSPLCIALAIGVKLSSPGPIFYKQERIGKNRKPFTLYKFRSMYINAEENGPLLSSDHDSRITNFGKYLRKWHLDEIPQFINVIIGDMSLVGPRPERKFFIDQILPRAPHYAHIFTVKPGITSWGMVKYGYAENVDQMLERMQYDILYLENRTLVVDFKILLYTIRSIVFGDGK